MGRKILSIVLPTYNRAKFLPRTLSAFQEQMERNRDKVSFLVCDNASTDGSEEILKTINKNGHILSIKYSRNMWMSGIVSQEQIALQQVNIF